MAALLLLSTFKLPMFSHVAASPNGDLLHNVLVLGAVVLAAERPKDYVATAVLLLAVLVSHERALVLLPALFVWHADRLAQAEPGCWRGPSAKRRALSLAAAYATPAVVSILYKQFFYRLNPPEGEHQTLGFVDQFYRLIGDPRASGQYVGSPWDNLVSMENITWNGLYYASFLVLAGVGLASRRPLLAWFAVLVYAGTVVQILVAEDVHRLTSYLFLPAVVLAVEYRRLRSPLQAVSALFVAVSFASVYVRNLYGLIGAGSAS
jgi:hypothetical protein